MMNGQQRTKIVRVNGVDLHYVETGKGEPIVLVHGSLSDFRSWSLQRKFFSKWYHTIAYSRRYHYPNPLPRSGSRYSAALHTEDLAGLIKALGLGAVHLVGSSYGAYIALLMAARHPRLVRTLVIGEPPILPMLKKDAEGAPLLRAFLDTAWKPSTRAFQSGNTELGVRLFYEGISSVGSFDKLPGSVRKGMMENAPSMKAEALARNSFPAFTKKDAQRIQAPCLLVSGELSPTLFHRITDILEDWLNQAERVVVPGASHSIHSHKPQAYNKIVLRFLSRHESGRI